MKNRWKLLRSELVYDAGVVRLLREAYEHAGAPIHDFYLLDAPVWVNVVALTAARQVVLVRQYRHGIKEVTLEVPGGVMDPSDSDPGAAAARELLEETGYGSEPLVPLGAITCNPAILANRTYSFFAPNARRVAEPCPDAHEDIEMELCPLEAIPRLLREGAIHHALSVSALALLLLREAPT
ncbi:MAG: NUDIX hydrolase [Planctomycetaceae bacterium]